jgi:phosphate/sulfate permease
LIPYRKAAILVAFFILIGGLLQGHEVMETVGKGIVSEKLPLRAMLIAMISSGFFVTLATFYRVPVSTSQAIVGAVAGVGIAAGAKVNFSEIFTIVEAWAISPILTAIIAFLIYNFAAFALRKVRRVALLDRILGFSVILSGGYLAFSLGANHVGTATGPILSVGIKPIGLIFLGGIAIAVGTLTYGKRVTQTIGGGITPLDPAGAFSAQLSAGLAVHLFSLLGIPVSTSQAVVGAIIGVGLVKGTKAVSKGTIGEIIIGWVATPSVTALLAYGLYWLVNVILLA